MRKPLALAILLTLPFVSAAHAAMPQFEAACGGMMEVHDEDGTVYINGKPAKLAQNGGSSYTATRGKTTVTIQARPNGLPNITYSRNHDGGDCNLTR